MKQEYKGYIIKINFWGDTTTPMYRYRLYKPRKNWFPKLVWTESIHGSLIFGKLSDEFDKVINNHKSELKKWG